MIDKKGGQIPSSMEGFKILTHGVGTVTPPEVQEEMEGEE